MNTHTPVHASAAPTPARTAAATAPRPAGPHFQGRQTFPRSVHSEWIKLWTLWSTWISSIITIALSVLFGAGVVISSGQVEHLQGPAKNYITYGLSFGQIVVAVLGALVITGEYSSGQIRSSLTAVPNRGRLLLSKAVVLSVVAFILGSLSTFLSWAGKILGCLPSTVSEAVNDPFHQAREWGSTTDPTFFLTHGQAIAVFAAWTIVPLLIAWFVFSRRDA